MLVAGDKVGQARRSGTVLRVEGTSVHQKLWVRWDDGHESLFMPSAGMSVEHQPKSR